LFESFEGLGFTEFGFSEAWDSTGVYGLVLCLGVVADHHDGDMEKFLVLLDSLNQYDSFAAIPVNDAVYQYQMVLFLLQCVHSLISELGTIHAGLEMLHDYRFYGVMIGIALAYIKYVGER
jgi:hypothetical protein